MNDVGARPKESWSLFWRTVALMALALVAIDVCFGLVMDRAYLASSKNPIAQINQAKPEWLVVGSSLAKYGVDPANLGRSVYNAGRNGQGTYYVSALLSALPDETTVKTIIWFFDPADLAEPLGSGDSKNLRAMAPLSKWVPDMRPWLAAGNPTVELALHSNLYRYRLLAPGILVRALRPVWLANGFEPAPIVPQPKPDKEQVEPPVSKPAILKENPPIAISPDGLAKLLHLAEVVRSRGLKLVVVSAPIYRYDRLDDPSLSELFQEMRAALADLPVCDLTTNNGPTYQAFINDGSLYFDDVHFNASGTEAFSKFLDAEITRHCPKDLFG